MQKLSFLFLIITTSLQAQIKFDTLDWHDVLNKASSSKQLIFLSADTKWCEPCDEMNQYVFPDLEVGNFYNRHFINVKLDMEQYPGIDLAEKYKIGVYPTFLYLNGKGEVVHRGCGAMDASDLLLLGEIALDENNNLLQMSRIYQSRDFDGAFLMRYLSFMESACLDAEGLAAAYLKSKDLEGLKSEEAWAVFAMYNWDIFSREFQYVLTHLDDFKTVINPKAVQAKLYDTYLSQYQEIYTSQELHGFGMRSLLHSINQVSFDGADTLKAMMNLHYAEYVESWEEYATHAIRFVEMMSLNDPEELSELAWKFYLFVEGKEQLKIAASWAKASVDKLPEPSIIDTYASLQFKLGKVKEAIELETRALELAKELYEDTRHFEYQLLKFKVEK